MIDRLNRETGLMQKALSLRAYRQELLASNIANADTPYYKARDLDFRAALDNAVQGRKTSLGGLELARTANAHMAGDNSGLLGGDVKYRSEYQSAVDGNTVNMDIERSAFAENAVQLEALLTFTQHKFRGLTQAIQGQ